MDPKKIHPGAPWLLFRKKKKKSLGCFSSNDDVWLRIEGKTGKKNPNRSRVTHVGRVPSKLTGKVNRRFVLQVFETLGDKLLVFKL
jgi:hypothetical protein